MLSLFVVSCLCLGLCVSMCSGCWLNDGVSALVSCSMSFTDTIITSGKKSSVYNLGSKCCPAHCLELTGAASSTDNASASVCGSFPYAGHSSVCLSAIHSGLINNTLGGWVWYDFFAAYHHPVIADLRDPHPMATSHLLVNGVYQQVLANISFADLFPYNSSSPSLSNGVQSVAAVDSTTSPSADTSSSLTIANVSYTVYSRGTLMSQRQFTPFSARAGHVYTFHNDASNGEDRWPLFHLIIGGRNDSHYLNDVWLGEMVALDPAGVAGLFSWTGSFMQWYRLPDAPFTGRADVTHRGTPVGYKQVLTFIGGQTGHHCGLLQLSICNDEVWNLNITMNRSSPSMGLSFTWSSQPISYLPFVPRCGSSDLPSFQSIPAGPYPPPWVFVIGGQVNYTDETCSAPVITVNDVWSSSDLFHSLWVLDSPSPPFSPRSYAVTGWQMSGQSQGSPPINPPMYTLSGGLQIINHTVNGSTGLARLVKAEIYSEIWVCCMQFPATSSICGWMTNNVSDPEYGTNYVIASLPLPIAGTQPIDLFGRIGDNNKDIMIGGRTAQQAVIDWSNTVPPLSLFNNSLTKRELQANVTMILQPPLGLTPGQPHVHGIVKTAPFLADITVSRFGLPLSYTLNEMELNDPNAPFLAGISGSFMHTFFNSRSTSFSFSSSQQVQMANDSSVFVYQASSSLNTTRRLFDLSLHRHSHRSSTSSIDQSDSVFNENRKMMIVSGGQSANFFFSDWLNFSPGICCPEPTDPSYTRILGNGTFTVITPGPVQLGNNSWCVQNALMPISWSNTIIWTCAVGFHLEPARTDDARSTRLTCLDNGLWMDTSISSISTCVKDRLNCSFPEIDDGDELCVLPPPTVNLLLADNVGEGGCVVHDNFTLVQCPVCPDIPYRLVLSGTYLTQPLLIYVGGEECTDAVLHDEHNQVICDRDVHNDTQCLVYGTGLTCQMSCMMGYNLLVRVYSGVNRQEATTPRLRISFTPPSIASLTSADCSSNPSAVVLSNCPYDQVFAITIAGLDLWFGNTADESSYPQFMLGTTMIVQCSYDGISSQDFVCLIQPVVSLPLNTAIPILVRQAAGPDNLLFNDATQPVATISLMGCMAGTRDVAATNTTIQPMQRCQPCPAGMSTNNQSNQVSCSACSAGTNVSVPGTAMCGSCPVNTYAPGAGFSTCLSCLANSYQASTGQSECHICDLNQYLVFSTNTSEPTHTTSATCQPCLSYLEAQCYPNGTIIAATSSSYLLVDQGSGLISSIYCHGSRCVSGSLCLSRLADWSSYATNVSLTGLSVVNCCSSHRLPANVNPLCAVCEPGYTEWSSFCVRCDWEHVNFVALIGLILLAWILVWILHRLPSDRHHATMSILFYFIQMTLVFFSSQQLPPLLSLLNLDLLADWRQRGSSDPGTGDDDIGDSGGGTSLCLAPLSAMNKMIVRSLMPLFALVLLLFTYLLHSLCHACCIKQQQQSNNSSGSFEQPAGKCKRFGLMIYHFLFGNDQQKVQRHDKQQESEKQLTLSPSRTSASSSSSSSVFRPLSQPLLSSSVAADAGDSSGSASSFSLSSSSSVMSFSSYLSTSIRIAVYGYNTIALVTLSYFHCESAQSLGSFLYDEPSLDCASSTYHSRLALFIALLVIVVIFAPLTLSIILFCYRRAIHAHVRYLHHTAEQADSAAEDVAAAAPSASSPFLPRWLISLDLLYSVYRAGSSQYSVLILFRRFLLISLFVFVTHSPQLTFSLLTLSNGLFLAIHMHWWPYHRGRDNRMEALSLCVLFIQTGVISVWPLPWFVDSSAGVTLSAENQALAVSLLLLLIVFPLCAILGSGVLDKYQSCRHNHKQEEEEMQMQTQDHERTTDAFHTGHEG